MKFLLVGLKVILLIGLVKNAKNIKWVFYERLGAGKAQEHTPTGAA